MCAVTENNTIIDLVGRIVFWGVVLMGGGWQLDSAVKKQMGEEKLITYYHGLV